MSPHDPALDDLCINAVRFLAADAVEAAGSGHPGMPMGMAPAATILWREFLRDDPVDPDWPDRDRFVLSAGHGSMLLYALLHLTGYDLPMEEIRRFRQWNSRTPGHPEYRHTKGVEVTTGPLGQGISNAVGFALAEKKLAAEFNRPGHEVVSHRTWVIASDGDMMEGVSGESCSLAGSWRLFRLAVLYDANEITIDGPARLAFTEDVRRRYEAYGWRVIAVEDGNDPAACRRALRDAHGETEHPSLVIVPTRIAYGSPKEGTAAAHGEPLGSAAIDATRRNLGWPHAPFQIPQEVYEHMDARARGRALREDWLRRFDAWGVEHPELRAEFLRRAVDRRLPVAWDLEIPDFASRSAAAPSRGDVPSDEETERSRPFVEEPLATRAASGKVLAAISPGMPELLGGSADLTPSNNTKAPDMDVFSHENPAGRYIHFGVREHAMGAILNGLVVHGGYRPYGGTFLVFSDYMRPAIRMAAIAHIPSLFVFTHDSIALGEDGPTHQPVEHLMSLRAVPGLYVVRPADAAETAEAWRLALSRFEGPTALVLTRQKLPLLDRTRLAPAAGLHRGGYVIQSVQDEVGAIVATGSEVHLALATADALANEGIAVRVVSLPCWERFEEQAETYRHGVLPPDLPALSIEAGTTLGWERHANASLGLTRFGASAPGDVVYRELGFTVESAMERVLRLLGEWGA